MSAAPSESLSALRSSVDRLNRLITPLDDTTITAAAYPTEWSIADVMSHLGSGAVIWSRRIEHGLGHANPAEDLNEQTWADWNAKSLRDKVDDGLAADSEFTARLESLSANERASLRVSMGPMEFDWEASIRMRLADHLLHEWDIAVALDDTAALADDGTAVVVDNLEMIARWTGKTTGRATTITVVTTAPARTFVVDIGDAVTLVPAEQVEPPTIAMPAEALIRLVYGRLDPDHTPASIDGDTAALEELREVFTGL